MAAPGPELLEESRFRYYDGPIGFAPDIIFQWHRELAFVIRFLHSMDWKPHRPIILSNIFCVQTRWSTPGYPPQLRIIEVAAAELSRDLRAPQRRARRRPNHCKLSTGKSRTRQPLCAVKNAPLPVIAITPLEQHV
jgi:hypothetical protein